MGLHLSRKGFLPRMGGNPFATPGCVRYLGIAAVALALASCSEEAGDEPQVDVTKSEITVNNNSAELSKRVTLYGKYAASTRSGEENASGVNMPEMPEVPADALSMVDFQAYQAQSGASYHLAADSKAELGLQFNGCTYYISGELTISSWYGTSGTLVVMPGGKVVCKPSTLEATILNFGEFEFDSSIEQFNINGTGSFMTNSDLTPACKLHIGGTFYVGGNLDTKPVSFWDNGILQVDGILTVDGDVEVSNSSQMYANNGICATNIKLNSGATVNYGCELIATEKLYITNGTAVHVDSYVYSPEIKMDSYAKLEIAAGGLVWTEKLEIANNSANINVSGKDGEYAVVYAEEITVHQSELENTFTGWMDLHYDNIINNSGEELSWLSNVKHNGDTYLPEEGCHPEFGTKPTGETGPKVLIDHIAQVDSPDHSHYISATCIQTVGDKAYVSYHTQGTGFHGCVEVMQVPSDGSNCKLLSFMEHQTLDFNHLMVDGNRIIAAGDDPNKGAFLGIVPLENGIFSTGQTELQQVTLSKDKVFEAGSTNCVIRNGDYLYVTTNRGYCTLDATTLDKETFVYVPTGGSSKFVHKSGSKIGFLSLTQRDVTESGAVMEIYGDTDYELKNCLQRFEVGTITPINGKDVAQVDGDDVYVCLGENGVKKFTNGTEVASFKVDPKLKAAANGMYVDSKYLYVAYGGAGLFVLDKTTLKEVASYRYSGGKSANYVSVSGNILYVAYGLSGVQVFKLIEQ